MKTEAEYDEILKSQKSKQSKAETSAGAKKAGKPAARKMVADKPVVAEASSEVGEATGVALLLIPLIGTMLVWFWVGGMALIQDPGGSLNLILVGVVVSSALLIGVEASQLGMGKNGKKGETGPVAWALGAILIWFIVYPCYLFARGKHGAKNLGAVGMFCALIFVGVCWLVGTAVEERKSEVSSILSGGAASSSTRDFMKEINQSVTKDFIRQYEIVKRSGNQIEASVHAGLVAAGFLQEGDEAGYRKWTQIQKDHESRW